MAEKKTFAFDLFHDSFRADSTRFFELINWRCFFFFFSEGKANGDSAMVTFLGW